MNMLMQIITDGAISANFVIGMCFSVIGVLILILLNDIRSSVRSLVQRQNDQGEKLTQNIADTRYAHKRIDELKESIT